MNYILVNMPIAEFPPKIADLKEQGYGFQMAYMLNFRETGDWGCARFPGAVPSDPAFDPPGVEYRRDDDGWHVSSGEPSLPADQLDSLLNYFKTLDGSYWT